MHTLEQAAANVDAEVAALDRNVDGIVEQINSAFQVCPPPLPFGGRGVPVL